MSKLKQLYLRHINRDLINISKSIGEDYHVELYMFRLLRLEERFSFVSFDFNIAYKGDHSPALTVYFEFLNVRILDFTFYNINHEG